MIVKYKKNVNQFNAFLGLLRLYLSFLVVNAHCFKPPKSLYKKKFILKLLKGNIHVPIFFMMSFYFCYNILSSKNIEKIKLRFERLIIPYFIWPIIIFIINKYLLNNDLKISLYDLFIQLLYGHRYNTVFWFQYDLILVTIIFVISELLFYKLTLFFFINLEIISFYFQYSQINYKLFSYLNFYNKFTFGRLAEIMPFCVTGYIFAYLKVSKFSKQYKLFYSYILFILLLFFIHYNVFNNVRGFYYQGFKLYTISLLIFNIFLLIPSEIISNNTFIKFIN